MRILMALLSVFGCAPLAFVWTLVVEIGKAFNLAWYDAMVELQIARSQWEGKPDPLDIEQSRKYS